MDSEWSRSDLIGTCTLGITIFGATAAWLTVPGFREWVNGFKTSSDPITLGNLATSTAAEYSMPHGVADATSKTLEEIDHALPASTMEWLHEKDFGGAFRWKMIEAIETYAWLPAVPAREFLDHELESLRLKLVASAREFIHLVAVETDDIHPESDDDIRKIPDQYDENGSYSDRLFFQKARVLNDAAEQVWEAYKMLFRRARVKLAYSSHGEEKQ